MIKLKARILDTYPSFMFPVVFRITTYFSSSLRSMNNGALTKYDIQSASSGGTSNAIRDQLYTDLNGGAGGTLSSFTVTKSGNHGLLVELGDVDGEISVFNEAGDNTNYLGVVWREVSAITDLPEYCVADLVVKVVGDVELNQDDYYVKFRTSDGGSEGVGTWEETAAPNISTGLDSSTMPHALVNTGYNTFEFGPLSHGQREAGDDDTNPHPSFVGNKIEDAFFYKNRLGYLSRSDVVMSESGEFFNHYRLTVLDLLDSAPIDVAASSAAVSTFRSAVGFQENLILFTDDSQFVLKGADILSPKTVSINPATRYNVNKSVRPLALGSYLYFPSEQTSFAGVREFIVNTDSSNYDSVDITEHVPAYIPRDVRIFTGNTATNHLVVGSANEPKALYVYAYFWSGTQKVVSAWSKFTFNADIIGASFIDDVLYLITVDDTETHLVSLPFSNPKDEAGFTTYLDNREEVTVDSGGATVTVSSVAGSDLDNFAIYTQDGLKLSTTGSPVSVPKSVLGYGVNDGVGIASIYRFYLDPAGGSSSTFTYHTVGANFATQTVYGAVLVSNPTTEEALEAVTNGGPITAPPSSLRYTLGQAQPEDTKLWTGHQYNMKYTFSELLFKAAAGNSKSPSNAAKLKVRNGSLFYNDSAYFKVSVTPLYRDTYENVFTPDVVGSTTLGELNLDSGAYRFPVFSNAEDTTITITNDSALPSNITSAEFESFVHSRSNRYAG